ncbi:hypothetical protein [Nocardioides alcanivorans]|uniref:hypothetical protein n=1 Tax=Nocardioides alcanivorans TaxID=2897352 RepID=UPI001F166C58|nr:hypothetical protein [Nocardioides alcanivorans]
MGIRVVVLAVTMVLATLSPATAEPEPAIDELYGEVAVKDTPDVLDGRVNSVTVVDGTVVLGGEFTKVRDNTTGTVLTRRNLVAFDAVTGRVVRGFATSADGPVNSVLDAGDGTTVFVAGHFDKVAGEHGATSLACGSPTGRWWRASTPAR